MAPIFEVVHFGFRCSQKVYMTLLEATVVVVVVVVVYVVGVTLFVVADLIISSCGQ